MPPDVINADLTDHAPADPSLSDILSRIRALPPGRHLIALAGPPGAGKSTLAAALGQALGPDSVVVPMDGFHLDNHLLIPRGLLARKGAPETFDAAGLLALLQRFAAGGAAPYPVFDRTLDLSRAQAGEVTAAHRFIIVEGNYLLLDQPVWRDMAALWSLAIRLKVPEAELERRLVARWLDHGLDADAALARAQGNDLPNARLVLTGSLPGDLDWSPAPLSETTLRSAG